MAVQSSKRMLLFFMAIVASVLPCSSFLIDGFNPPIRIAAFNIRHFGRSLMDNDVVVGHLQKVIGRYDIVLVQETRDSTGTALPDLAKTLSSAGPHTWRFVASSPLGRTQYYQEQYAFLYTDNVQFVSSHQVNDTDADLYEREPFAAEFQYSSGTKNVVLLAFHSKPTKTKEELQHLPDTIKAVAGLYPRAAGVITMGDMNADCDYLTGKWRSSLEVFNGDQFRSLIPESADSAVSDRDCAYDRIIVYGKGVDARDAKVFDFQTHLKLSQAEALQVSDHFPVEFSLY